MPDAPRLIAILGSVTPPGRMHGALGGGVDRINAGSDASCTLVDLATLPLGFAEAPKCIDRLVVHGHCRLHLAGAFALPEGRFDA